MSNSLSSSLHSRSASSQGSYLPPHFPVLPNGPTIFTDASITSYTVLPSDSVLIFTNNTGNVTITLPTDSLPGRQIYFALYTAQSLLSATSNVVQLDNSVTNAIAPYQDWRVLVYGGDGNWYTMMQY